MLSWKIHSVQLASQFVCIIQIKIVDIKKCMKMYHLWWREHLPNATHNQNLQFISQQLSLSVKKNTVSKDSYITIKKNIFQLLSSNADTTSKLYLLLYFKFVSIRRGESMLNSNAHNACKSALLHHKGSSPVIPSQLFWSKQRVC